MADSLKALSHRLKLTREALGLNAAQLGKRIDCKPNRWSQYENGERPITLPIAIALCAEFGLTLDWIYRGDPSRLPHEVRIKIRSAA
jgi:transcriptional regulator with XRE-family HTH domain